MLNGMTKVATPLLASSLSLGRPIGAPRVFKLKILVMTLHFKVKNACSPVKSSNQVQRLTRSLYSTTYIQMSVGVCLHNPCMQYNHYVYA